MSVELVPHFRSFGRNSTEFDWCRPRVRRIRPPSLPGPIGFGPNWSDTGLHSKKLRGPNSGTLQYQHSVDQRSPPRVHGGPRMLARIVAAATVGGCCGRAIGCPACEVPKLAKPPGGAGPHPVSSSCVRRSAGEAVGVGLSLCLCLSDGCERCAAGIESFISMLRPGAIRSWNDLTGRPNSARIDGVVGCIPEDSVESGRCHARLPVEGRVLRGCASANGAYFGSKGLVGHHGSAAQVSRASLARWARRRRQPRLALTAHGAQLGVRCGCGAHHVTIAYLYRGVMLMKAASRKMSHHCIPTHCVSLDSMWGILVIMGSRNYSSTAKLGSGVSLPTRSCMARFPL